MLRALALSLALLPAPLRATAGPDQISVLVGSYHIDAAGNYEEFNPGVFLTWDRALRISTGVFRNSYGKTSVLATVATPILSGGKFNLDLFAGAALYPGDGRRFDVHIGDILPIGGVQLRYGAFFSQIIPGDGHSLDGLVTLGLTFDLHSTPLGG
jgi:hypothetical protein